MPETEELLWREVLQRLTAIESDINSLKKSLDNMHEKADIAYRVSLANEKEIDDLKRQQTSNKNWLMGIVATILGYIFTNYFLR